MDRKIFGIWGALAGLIAYVAFALKPAALFGEYAGALLETGVLGTPLDIHPTSFAFAVGGIVFATFAVCFLFVVVGAAIGSGVFALVERKTL
jgi:hypothetical protein